MSVVAAWAQNPVVPVCVHDTAVLERFLPVQLLTGHPMPEGLDLVLPTVGRTYPFVDELPDRSLGAGEVSLKGPIKWEGQGGTVFDVYERKVPRAFERYALTPDRTAMGRVYEQRFGNAVNEGKYPVGMWKQGQKRTYATTYHSARGPRQDTTSVEIENLSCVYDGVPGAMQCGWKTGGGTSYGYIYAPGKGVVHVMTRVQGGRGR